jgi:hypothetical protein
MLRFGLRQPTNARPPYGSGIESIHLISYEPLGRVKFLYDFRLTAINIAES